MSKNLFGKLPSQKNDYVSRQKVETWERKCVHQALRMGAFLTREISSFLREYTKKNCKNVHELLLLCENLYLYLSFYY